jgi:cobalamin synthase
MIVTMLVAVLAIFISSGGLHNDGLVRYSQQSDK